MINRNLLFLFLVILAYLPLYSQNTTFSDDFEAYATGAFVAQSNNKWTTWTNKPGTEEDAQISEDIAHSGKKSAKFEAVNLTTGGPTDLVLPFSRLQKMQVHSILKCGCMLLPEMALISTFKQ